MSRVTSATLLGVDGVAVEVEVRLSSQLPRVDVVGLPEAAVRESAARVRAAIAASGEQFPDRRVTVNLAPAGLRKSGPGLDLPIAVGDPRRRREASRPARSKGSGSSASSRSTGACARCAARSRSRSPRGDAGCMRVARPGGERAPRPRSRPASRCTRHAHLGAVLARAARRRRVLDRVHGALAPARACDRRRRSRGRARPGAPRSARSRSPPPAATTLLFRGPPGAGKTMLARRLPGSSPPLVRRGARGDAHPRRRRAPAARARGARSRAGPSARRTTPRAARAARRRQPAATRRGHARAPRRALSRRAARVRAPRARVAAPAARGAAWSWSRAQRHAASFPARFQLVAAMNPCPCGWRLSACATAAATTAPSRATRARLSGPLLDRIDLHVDVPAVRWRELDAPARARSTRRGPGARRRARTRRRAPAAARGARRAGERAIPAAALDALAAATPRRARAARPRGGSPRALGARRPPRAARRAHDRGPRGRGRVGAAPLAEALGYRMARAEEAWTPATNR